MVDLGRRVLVLSPHLDDAVLSVGATIAAHVEGGGVVKVATVFAGDPESLEAAGAWDALCGFSTAGAAARWRRMEDAQACGDLGATFAHLPYADDQYRSRRDGDEVFASLNELAAEADSVLVPGWPLSHADHAWVALFGTSRLPGQIVLYAEEPYSSWLGADVPPAPALPAFRWEARAASRTGQVRKGSAIRRYDSQMDVLGSQVRTRELSGGVLSTHLAEKCGRIGEPLAVRP